MVVVGVCWSFSQFTQGKGRKYNLGKSPLSGHTHTPFTPEGNLESPISHDMHTTCIWAEYPEKACTVMAITEELGTFLLLGD